MGQSRRRYLLLLCGDQREGMIQDRVSYEDDLHKLKHMQFISCSGLGTFKAVVNVELPMDHFELDKVRIENIVVLWRSLKKFVNI